jgi:hypothetical protein
MRGEPVPSMMLTLPTPEIPTTPFFDPQPSSSLIFPELTTARPHSQILYLSADRFASPALGSQCTFDEHRHISDETEKTGLEEPCGIQGDSNVSSSLLSVPAQSTGDHHTGGDEEGSFRDIGTDSGEAPGDAKKVREAESLDIDSHSGDTATKTQKQKRKTFWTKFQNLFNLHSRSTTAASMTNLNLRSAKLGVPLMTPPQN